MLFFVADDDVVLAAAVVGDVLDVVDVGVVCVDADVRACVCVDMGG